MKIIKNLVIFILSVILLITIILTNIYIMLITSITGNAIEQTVNNIDVNDIIEENREIYDDLCKELENQFGIEQEMVDNILNSEVSKNVVGKVAGSYMEYMLTGDESAKLQSDDVINMIEENINDAIDLTNIEIAEEDLVQIKENVIKQIKENSEVIDETLNSIYDVDITKINVDVNNLEDIKNIDINEIKNNEELNNIIDMDSIDKDKIDEVGGDIQDAYEQYRNKINIKW